MAATVLVVEDEPAIQELISYNLQQAGHQPMRAGSAEDALNIMRHALPDLVLVDWMLPGLSGIELARRIKSDKRTKTVPIIMLTARAAEEDKLTGLETGADDYITKPFSPRELNARVKAVLRRRAPQMTDDWWRSRACGSTRRATASPATASRSISGRPSSGCCTS